MATEQITGSPFVDNTQSDPFVGDMGLLFPEGETPEPGDRTATPMRGLTIALSRLSEQNPRDPDSLVQLMQQNVTAAQTQLQQGQERNLQLQTFARQTIDRTRAIRNLSQEDVPGGTPLVSQSDARHVADTFNYDRAVNAEQLSRSAMEDEAIRNAVTYYQAGDDVGFRLAVNSITPERATTAGAMRDNFVRELVLTNAIERAQLDENEEPFWHSFLTAVISIPESILLGGMFQQLGNVDRGTAGYDPGFFRWLTPGTEMGNQILAVQSMNAHDLAEYLPHLLQNVRGNSTTLGLTDPGRVQQILSEFRDGLENREEWTRNAMSWLDMAAIIPFTKVGRVASAFSGSRLFMAVGARDAAAGRIAQAVETMVAEGEPAAMRQFGVSGTEVIENALPSRLNPVLVRGIEEGTENTPLRARLTSEQLKSGIDPEIPVVQVGEVSLSGEVSDTMAAARTINEAMRTPESSTRFFSEQEPQAAIQAAMNRIKERTGSNIADYEMVPVDLPSGQQVMRLNATLDRRFATEEEALGFMRSNGYGAEGTEAAFREGEPLAGPSTTGPSRYANSPIKTFPGSAKAPTINSARDFRSPEVWGSQETPETFLYQEYKELEQKFNREVADLSEIEQRSDTVRQALWEQILEDADINVSDQIRSAQMNPANPQARLRTVKIPNLTSVNDSVIVEDISGAFYPRVSVDVSETGFYTNPLDPPRTGYISRFLLNPSQTEDRRLFEMQTEAGRMRQRFLKKINKDLVSVFRKIPAGERPYLHQLLMKGDNMERWFSDVEAKTILERAMGSVPSDNTLTAYRQFKVNNDLEHIIRDATMYNDLVIRGAEDVTFSPFGIKIQGNGFVDISPTSLPRDRVFDVSESRHYNHTNTLTRERLQELSGQGYYLVRTEDYVKLQDGTEIRNFLIKRSDMETNPLRRNQLNYRPGGHRLYVDKYFVKQAVRFRQPDEANQERLKRPNVYVTGPTQANVAKWAETMNQARLMVKDEGAGAARLDQEVFQGRRGFPTGDEFLTGIEDQSFSLDDAFEAVFDRELPTAYRSRTGLGQFVDEDEAGFAGFYRTTGRLYYSRKGEALRRFDGELSPTIDPFEAQSKALYNVSQLSSFSDFKTSSIDRWVRTYRSSLNVDVLPQELRDSPVEIFNSATVNRNETPSLRAQIESQRANIKRVLGFQTDWDRNYQNAMRSAHEWIVGDSDNTLRQTVSKAPLWFLDRNPVSSLRGLAFDMKLGLGNVGQFFIQTSTMFSALSLSPKYGTRGLFSVPIIRSYLAALKNGTGENMLDLWVKRGGARLAGFEDVNEFKDYIRYSGRSGLFDLGETHSLVNASGPASTFAIQSGAHAAREMGRFFFYEAEIWNRLVAHRIAYGEAVEKFGKQPFTNNEFRQYIVGRAENYSFNMSDTSKAAWQGGLMSIPTQFWAYNVRMLEALVGRNFTVSQKIRLAMAQLGMAGTAGLPLAGAISEWYNNSEGAAPNINTLAGTAERGIVDRTMYELFGADVEVGKRWGTGDFWLDTTRKLGILPSIFGQAQYGAQSVADMTGGATYTILGDALGTFYTAAYMAAHESGGESMIMTEDSLTRFSRSISSVNNFLKASLAYQYGIYQTTSGYTLLNDRTDGPDSNVSQSAFFYALGFTPGELRDLDAANAWRDHRQQSIHDVSTTINNLWQDSLNRPDHLRENAETVNALVNLVPVTERMEVLRQTHLSRDGSMYQHILRLNQRDQAIINATEEVNDTHE